MKSTLIRLLVATAIVGLVLLVAPGCGVVPRKSGPGDGALIQRLLDYMLPADFRGDAVLDHNNPWVDVVIDAGDLRRENGRWVWDWLRYRRNGRGSHGYITLGSPPPDWRPGAVSDNSSTR